MLMLSIVIPCYNAQKYLRLAVSNLKKQTYENWEAIFVDDGSTDQTGEILNKLLDGKEKYKVIHKVNGGNSQCKELWNRGGIRKIYYFFGCG